MATALVDSFSPVEYAKNHFVLKDTISRFIEQQNSHGGNTGLPSKEELIGNALRERVESVDHEFCAPGEEDTFFVADLGEVFRQHLRWKLNLPRVKPFYGKENPFLFLATPPSW